MSTTPHPLAQLSAYLDQALSPVERSSVNAHLATCADCRSRLEELRGTAALLAALPSPAPSRRLVPRIATVPAWLAPLRTLSTLASGIAVFMFIASALLANIGPLATSSATAASQLPLLVPAGGAANAPAASSGAFRNSAGSSAAAAPAAAQDAAKSVPSPSPSVNALSQTSAAPSAAADHATSEAEPIHASPVFGSPWMWLAIAIVSGAIAILLQRRLRRA